MGSIGSSDFFVGFFGVAMLAMLLAGLVLGIMAIVSGNSSKRLLRTHSSDAGLNGKAGSAVVLGWSALAVFALFWIIHIATRAPWMPF